MLKVYTKEERTALIDVTIHIQLSASCGFYSNGNSMLYGDMHGRSFMVKDGTLLMHYWLAVW